MGYSPWSQKGQTQVSGSGSTPNPGGPYAPAHMCLKRRPEGKYARGSLSPRSLLVNHQGMWFVRWSDHPIPEKRRREASRARHPKSSR